jgi:hypothetical protein
MLAVDHYSELFADVALSKNEPLHGEDRRSNSGESMVSFSNRTRELRQKTKTTMKKSCMTLGKYDTYAVLVGSVFAATFQNYPRQGNEQQSWPGPSSQPGVITADHKALTRVQ